MAKVKVYRGWRDEQGRPHVTVNNHPLRHVQYHTDTFDWGQHSDGAADLALSILANYLGERPRPDSKRFLFGEYMSWRLHQDFTADMVATLSTVERWSVTGEQIARWLELQAAKRPSAEDERSNV